MKIFIALLISTLPLLTFAQEQQKEEKEEQNQNFVLCFGPSVNYFQGEYPGSFEVYESDYVNVQINGFIGYSSARSNRKNALGIFGTGGYTNQSTFLKMIEIQEIDVNQLDSSNYYTFYQVEAGMMAGNFLRFSSGYGRQYYKTDIGETSFEYFSSTIGLMIDFGSLAWNIDFNLNYGLDYSKTTVKLATGFMVKF